MSIEEKRDEIIAEYHCQDVHGEMCVDCAKCRECLKEDLIKLENLVRTEMIDECIKTIIDYCGGLPNGMYVNALEQLKESK